MNTKILEVSSKNRKGGRVPIKILIHEIYEDESATNHNGLHWKEEYVRNAMQSVISSPIAAEFLDNEKESPFGHGFTGVVINEDGNEEPVFENSVAVGTITEVSIERVSVNGSEILGLVGSGYLYNQRYPKFVSWVCENFASQVMTSVEIGGLEENDGKIIYEEDVIKNEFRTPKIYEYLGVSILSVDPADDNAVVMEISQKLNKEENEMDLNEIKSVVSDTIKELSNKEAEFNQKITELNSAVSEKASVIEAKDAELNEKEEKITELNASIESLTQLLDEAKRDSDVAWEKVRILEQEIAKMQIAEKLGELDKALEVFSDEEKEEAKEDIEEVKTAIENSTCTEDVENKGVEINNLINKIYASVGRNAKKALAEEEMAKSEIVVEQNSKADDIFSDMSFEKEEKAEIDEDVNIF